MQPARGFRGMLPCKFLNLYLLKSPEACIFLFLFAFSKFLRRATKLHEKGNFALVSEKWGGHASPVFPSSYVHILHSFFTRLLNVLPSLGKSYIYLILSLEIFLNCS